MAQKNISPQDKIIHIKFDSNEVIESKRDVLLTQESVIKLMQIVKNYRALREEELKRKIKLYSAFRKVRIDLGKLEENLPNLDVPKKISIPKRYKIKEIKKVSGTKKHDPLEKELREIQEKIRLLQQ